LIIFAIGIIGFTGTAFATHDPTYNHPTPILEPEPISEPEQEIPTGTDCGPRTTYQDGICIVDKIENTTKIPTDPSKRWGSFPIEPDCGAGTEYVNGVCEIIIIESSHYVNTSPYYQAFLMMGVFLWPFFISGAAIFIVLAKTPRYEKSTRIAVTLSGSLVIVLFLNMMFIGIWPQMGA